MKRNHSNHKPTFSKNKYMENDNTGNDNSEKGKLKNDKPEKERSGKG